MKKLFIGIDFAKEKFDAAIIEACGLKEFGNREYGTFTNDKRAIDSSSMGQNECGQVRGERVVILWRGHRIM